MYILCGGGGVVGMYIYAIQLCCTLNERSSLLMLSFRKGNILVCGRNRTAFYSHSLNIPQDKVLTGSLITLVLTCQSEMCTFSSDWTLVCPGMLDRAWKLVFDQDQAEVPQHLSYPREVKPQWKN